MKMTRYYILIASLVCAITTFGQSARNDSLYHAACGLYAAGEFKKAIPLFEQVVGLDSIESADDPDLIGCDKLWLASCHYRLGDVKRAVQAEPFYYELPPYDRALTAKIRSYAKLSSAATTIDNAIYWMQRCAEEEIAVFGENDANVYGSWCGLAAMAFTKGDEALCRDYIARAKAIVPKIPVTTTAWRGIPQAIECDLEMQLNNKEAAETLANEAWGYLCGSMQYLSMPYLRALETLLVCKTAKNDYEGGNVLAEIAAAEYLALDKNIAGEYSRIVNLLANYYYNSGQGTRGIELCDYAINLAAGNDEQRADLLYDRGCLLKVSGKAFDAAADLQASIDICRKLYPGQLEYLASHYLNLGECYDNVREFDKCREAYRTAQKGFKKQGDMGVPGYFQTLHHLGALATRTNNFIEAIEYIDECLQLMDAKGLGTVSDRAYMHCERGACLTGARRQTEAAEEFRQSISIYETEGLPLTDYTYFNASTRLCRIFMAEDIDNAEAAAIIAKLEKVSSGETFLQKRIRINLLQFHAEMLLYHGRFNEAVIKANEGLALAENDKDINVQPLYQFKFMGLLGANHHSEAMAELRQYEDKIAQRYGSTSKEYLAALMMGGAFVNKAGSFSDISELSAMGDKIASLARKVYSTNDPEYVNALCIAATMKGGTYPNDARNMLMEALKSIDYKRQSPDESTLMFAYSALAEIELNSGNYDKAVEYGAECMKHTDNNEIVVGRAKGVYTYGRALLATGRLAQAEEVLKKALEYALNINGGDNDLAYMIYQALADLYGSMGRVALAADYRAKADALRVQKLSDNDSVVFMNLFNGLWPKYAEGRKDECLEDIDKIEKAIEVMAKAPNIDMSIPSRLRGLYYMYEGKQELAEIYAQSALSLSRNVDNLALSAQVAFNKGDYATAGEYAREELELIEEYMGPEDFKTVGVHKMLGDVHLQQGDAAAATQCYRRAFDNGCRYIYGNLLNLTAAQRADFWASNYWFYRNYLPNLCIRFDTGAELNGLMYDAMLFSNGLLLNVDKSITRAVAAASDDVRGLYAELNGKKEMLRSLAGQDADNSELQDDVNRIEKELMRRLRESAGDDSRRWSAASWRDVRKALPKGAAAIEFMDFPVDSSTYAGMALVLTRTMKYPELRQLYRRAADDNLQRTDMYADTVVGSLVWSGLADVVAGCDELYFTPQGPLCSIAIESLPLPAGTLAPGVRMHRLSSTGELTGARGRRGKKRGATLYGGLNYDASVESMKEDADKYPELKHRGYIAENMLTARFIREGSVVIPYLEGSRVEIDSISSFIDRNTTTTPVTKTWNDGTETSFKALSGKYGRVLHISTHGFFAGDAVAQPTSVPGGSTLTVEDMALQSSGLLMSGAANKYVNEAEIPDDLDDGILTAAEIASLDLSDVDLAVLSACETGLGRVTGDGVFGLQRGFKKAGAGSILMSLWKVDDDATCRLMTEFYRHWLGDAQAGITPCGKYAALEAAKAAVRANPAWADPEYWAAFILLDALD